LTYNEILNDEKKEVLLKTFLLSEKFKFNSTDLDSRIKVQLNTNFMNHNGESKRSLAAVDNKEVAPAGLSSKMTLVFFICIVGLWSMFLLFISSESSFMDKYLCRVRVLLPVVTMLSISGFMLISTYRPKAILLCGLALISAFGLCVRYIVQLLPGMKMTYLKRTASPYFIGFLGLITLSGLLLTGSHERSSENVAVISYFFLITALAIEFIIFSKDNKTSNKLLE
jgi:hypothetical protein